VPHGKLADCISIEMNQEAVSKASAGHIVGLHLRYLNRREIVPGDVITANKEDYIAVTTPPKKLEARRFRTITATVVVKKGPFTAKHNAILDFHTKHIPL
jgi:translation elongation factor EF-1alpha